MNAFVDCDAFQLNANRGSIGNTDHTITEMVRRKVNEKLSSKPIRDLIETRALLEEYENTLRTVDKDAQELEKRFRDANRRKKIKLPDGQTLLEPRRKAKRYSESETLILLIQLLSFYPDLFKFPLLDYNTHEGIDFVVKDGLHPKYIELKGTMQSKVNHSFRNVFKFICYDIELQEGSEVLDPEELKGTLTIAKAPFESNNISLKGRSYTWHRLSPNQPGFDGIEIIVLKKLIKEVLGGTEE